jgi:hypothetical protein
MIHRLPSSGSGESSRTFVVDMTIEREQDRQTDHDRVISVDSEAWTVSCAPGSLRSAAGPLLPHPLLPPLLPHPHEMAGSGRDGGW